MSPEQLSEERIAAIRKYADESLKWAVEEEYEPGDEDTADALISARTIIKLCDGELR